MAVALFSASNVTLLIVLDYIEFHVVRVAFNTSILEHYTVQVKGLFHKILLKG